MTPATASAPYLTAAGLLRLADWRMIAELCYDGDGARPTKRALRDPATAAGAILAEFLLAASGDLESSALAGGRYAVEDVQALTASTAGGMWVRRLVTSLTLWHLMQRREPAAGAPDTTPGAAAALAILEQLRTGERVFAFEQARAAGGGPAAVALYDPAAEPGGSRTVARASRLFDTRED